MWIRDVRGLSVWSVENFQIAVQAVQSFPSPQGTSSISRSIQGCVFLDNESGLAGCNIRHEGHIAAFLCAPLAQGVCAKSVPEAGHVARAVLP